MDTAPTTQLSDDERTDLEALAREALRAAAEAPDANHALTWGDAACACLRVLNAPDGALGRAAALFDRHLPGAPFEARWETVTAPLAARAEAMNVRKIERDIDALESHLRRP